MIALKILLSCGIGLIALSFIAWLFPKIDHRGLLLLGVGIYCILFWGAVVSAMFLIWGNL